jgi:hypothetical protein
MSDSNPRKYPLLEEILELQNLQLNPTYSTRNVADIFKVSPRAIQQRVELGQLTARDLPGRARFLPADLEEFIRNSRKDRP